MKKTIIVSIVISFTLISPVTHSQIILELKCSDHIYFLNPQIGDTSKPAIETWELIRGQKYFVTITGEGGYQHFDHFPGIICSYYEGANFTYRVVPPYTSFQFRAGKEWFAAFVVDHNGLHNVWGTYTIRIEEMPASKDTHELIHFNEMDQNFPNPFNSTTKINFSIKEENKVRIDIYNVFGDLVRTLVNEVKPMGRYSVEWNGFDNKQNRVASGQYFYQIQMGDYAETKKMLLLK